MPSPAGSTERPDGKCDLRPGREPYWLTDTDREAFAYFHGSVAAEHRARDAIAAEHRARDAIAAEHRARDAIAAEHAAARNTPDGARRPGRRRRTGIGRRSTGAAG
ncbi:hypothetical protein [Actinomadura nitritigenes]|uniref:hypothetical protein n=1 Tax=Actinomadura nitritigenes TaxID=134602 RepID=UPI003D8C2C2E